MNKVVLIGRPTTDPSLKFTPGTGTAVATFILAVDRRVKNSQGNKEADFPHITVWGKQAENTATYGAKGKLIGISGRIQTRSYDAKDGSKRYVTEVVAEEVQFLEWADKGQAPQQQGRQITSGSMDFQGSIYEDEMTQVDDGDIPF